MDTETTIPAPDAADTPSLPDLNLILAGAPFTISAASEGKEASISGAFHPIPIPLWKALIGFHRQVSINHKAESISLHRWHAGEGRYHTIIPWQTSSYGGLYVNYDPTNPRNRKLFDDYGRKFGQEFFEGCCTIHTHVNAEAFESGTDAHDEERKPGWHITLGNLLSYSQYHMDFRIRVPDVPMVEKYLPTKDAYPIQWFHLFELGTSIPQIFQEPGTTDFHHFLHRVSNRRDHS